MSQVSKVHATIPHNRIKPVRNFNCNFADELPNIGIHVPGACIAKMQEHYSAKGSAMDALQPMTTTPSFGTPVQFLQGWIPGVVFICTQARKIDEAIGYRIVGDWADEQVVQTILERVGVAQPYTEYQNVPESGFNLNYVFNTIVNFESGMFIGNKESARTAKVNVSADNAKRNACTQELEISRNYIGFYGFNGGFNLTYGIFNTPGLPAYVTVANGDNGTPQWSTKTFLNITADIRTAANQLQTQSGDLVDPRTTPTTLFLPTNVMAYLTTVTDFGITVEDWLKKVYPAMRVVSAPQLNNANGGVGVFYLFADKMDTGADEDGSTDDGSVFSQNIQTKFLVNGVEKLAKGYLEAYLNSTAGVMCKRPFLVVRYSGIS